MSLLDEIGDYLIAQGVVEGSTGWALKKSLFPPDPDQVVSLFETSGEVPEIIAIGSIEKVYDKPGFQVRVRGNAFDYVSVRSKIQEIFNHLHQNEPPQTSGDLYIYLYGVSSAPLPMGLDQNNRPELVWNFRTMRKRI